MPCSQKNLCTQGKARTVSFSIHEDLIAAAIQRSESEKSKAFHRLRNIQAEGAFANLKEVLKFKKRYSVGLTSAQKRFVMGCAVINLKKLAAFLPCLRSFFYYLIEGFKKYYNPNTMCVAF